MKHLKISSPVFADRGNIPSKYTCDGEDINPPLEFENIPEDAVSLLLTVEDPDSPGKTWLHWALYNIDPHIAAIHEDAKPTGAFECVSDFGQLGYGGPCPARGIHRYVFKLFALDTMLHLTEDSTLAEIYTAIEGHILAQSQITGLYSRDGSF